MRTSCRSGALTGAVFTIGYRGTKVIFAVSEPEASVKAPSRVIAVFERLPAARIVAVLGIWGAAGIAWQVWRKWPLTMTDVEKICRVAELSRCPEQGHDAFSTCELQWLRRTTWRSATLKELFAVGREDGAAHLWHYYADFLRNDALQSRLGSCPRADRFQLMSDAFELCSKDAYESCLSPGTRFVERMLGPRHTRPDRRRASDLSQSSGGTVERLARQDDS